MDDEKACLVQRQRRSSEDMVSEPGSCRHREFCSRCSPRSTIFSAVSIAYVIVLHIICLSLGCYVLSLHLQASERPEDSLLDFARRYGPDWVPISYELRPEQKYGAGEGMGSEFAGPPNQSNTKAWDDLITPTFFSASLSELQMTDESIDDSVRLAEGGGYIAGLAVYHNIHCLRRLRLFLHSNYYYDNFTEANLAYLRGHLGHCIESLRRTIMCDADTTIYTFTWKDAELISPGIWRPRPKSSQEKRCVNWEKVENWVLERRVELNPVLLKPSGEEEKILM